MALSDDDLDPWHWLTSKCRTLPLTAWDAEADYRRFMNADRATRERALVACAAVAASDHLGRAVESAGVRRLAEIAWAHCRFVGRHLYDDPESSVLTEYAARTVVAYGNVTDAWILEQARNLPLGPCPLWALIDHRWPHPAAAANASEQATRWELTRIASASFGDGGQFDIEALRYWARLWLSLAAIDEAEETAVAILATRPELASRGDWIVALKLLAFVASERGSTTTTGTALRSLYRELWSHSELAEEREHRRFVDGLLDGTPFSDLVDRPK